MSEVHKSSLGYQVIGCAMEVHTQLGPGLLEQTYCRGLAYELSARGLSFRTEVPIPTLYKGVDLDCGYRADFIVEDRLLIEIKSVESLLPVHSAQAITYLKLTKLPQILLFNFNVTQLKNGMKSFLYRNGTVQIEGGVLSESSSPKSSSCSS